MTPNDVTDDDLIVDNTILSSTAQCHTQAALRHGLGYTTESESAAIMSGQFAHEVLAWWMCGKTPEEAITRLEGYREWTAEHGVGEDDRLAYSNVRRILKRWFQINPREKFPYVVNPADVEVPMVAELGVLADGQRVVMVALLDALVKSKTGGRWTMDHKTTKYVNDWFKDDLDDAAQFTGQLWIAEENGQPLSGVVINALEFRKIPDSNRKCNQHTDSKYVECGIAHVTLERFTATRTPAELVSWAKTALGLARTYAKLKAKVAADPLVVTQLPMQGRFNRACKNCEFREWCSMGRPKGSLRTFTERRWNPLERAKEHAEALGVIR